MKIRLTCDRFDGVALRCAGDEIDLPAPEAYRMLAGGTAEPVEPAAPETCTRPAPRAAARPRKNTH